MAEDIKSALHDATPSWNGFIYQGKVGLYVCLKLIKEKLQSSPTDFELSEFLNSYSIEYEWIEDFAIKVNSSYQSLHQVKHKAGTSFSSHISAIVTILNRKQKILSETDFNKYIKFDIEDKDALIAEISTVFDLMISAGYINQDRQLTDNWQDIYEEINNVDNFTLKKLLTDFHGFSNNAFDNSKVYFHTSEPVTPPKYILNEYKGMPENHKKSVYELRSLSTLDIYLGFDDQSDYELALSDQILEQKIVSLISDIISVTQACEVYSVDDIKLFLTALNKVVDAHIVARHKNIRTSNIQGSGFLEKRNNLSFIKLFEVFELQLRNTNEIYWELYCRQNFEYAFIEHVNGIQTRIDNDQDRVQSEKYLERLQQFRTDVLSKYSSNFIRLLRLLFPHEVQQGIPNNVYFSSITEKSKIKNVFLSFVQKIDSYQNGLIYRYSSSLAYHPTCIDVSHGDMFDWINNIEKCRHAITQNAHIREYFGATHLTVKAEQGHDISNLFVELPTIVDQIDMDSAGDFENKVSNVMKLKFERLNSAIEIINGN